MLAQLYTHWISAYQGIPRSIWFLALVNLINRCGGMVISFITLYLTQYLHFDIKQAGYIMGCFGVGAFTGAYFGGRLSDRWGYLPVMFWSLALNGAMLLLIMLVGNFWLMCAAVFLLSMFSEVFRPANSVAIADNSDPDIRTRAISLYRMSANIGFAIAPALGGLLIALGWHWMFWVDGLTCIGAAISLYLLIPPRKHRAQQQAAAAATVSDVDQNGPGKDRPFQLFVLLTMIGAIVFMQFLWTVPVYFKESYQWSESYIGMILAINGLLVFTIEMPLIFRIEGRRPELAFVRIGLLLYALAYLGFAGPFPALAAALFFIVAISLGEIFVMPFSSNFMFGRANKARQGAYSSWYVMAYSLANIIAPLLGTQIIASFGYNALWYVLAALSAIAWIGFWRLEKMTGSPV